MAILDDVDIYSKRRVLFQVVAVVFLLFFGRLYQLQMYYREEYGKKSEENSIRTIPREPVRGNMYDRNNVLIVDSRPAFTVTIMPFEFDKRNIPALANILGLEPSFIVDRLKRGEIYSRFVPVKIKRDIDFRTLSAIEENREHLPGVDYHVESKRSYVTKASASHLLGYAKEVSETQMKTFGDEYAPGDVAGASGLEAEYESVLRGTKGAELSMVNVRGQVIGRFEGGKNDVQPVEGKDLLLTLDVRVQALAESLMTGRRGAVVALDTQTGGVLALVSKPDFDLTAFSGVVPPDVWKQVNTDEAAPMFNRATQSRYPPGSTFKMLLALAALENHVVTPSWRITCPGYFRMGNKIFKDEHVHGSVDMVTAIQRSCNVYFYQLMLKVGLDPWSKLGQQFGFGKLTGIDIGEENPGLLPTTAYMDKRYGPNGWTLGFLPSLGIGQGELGTTPLQMACYAMTLANKGEYHQPHVVRSTVDKSNGVIDTIRYSSRDINISDASWNVVREGMRRAVMELGGTGGLARVAGVQVAGKTGTAQNPHGPSHAWFIGFAPFDAPRIAIAVMVENVGYGGSYAAPIAGLCIEQYLNGHLTRFDPLVH